jgi:hypothetical protein
VDKWPLKEMQRSTNSDENLSARFVSEVKSMTGLVMEDAGKRIDRNVLLKQQECMEKALDDIWNGVERGNITVDCLSLLRTAHKVSCPEIGRSLRSPEINHAKMIRDLNLLVNTFTYVIKLESSKDSF